MRIDIEHNFACYLAESVRPGSTTWRAKVQDFKAYQQFIRYFESVEMPTLGHLSPALLRAFQADMLDEEYAPATVNRRCSTIREFASWLNLRHPEVRLPSLNHCGYVKLPKLAPRSLTHDDVRRLRFAYSRIQSDLCRARVEFIFEFLLHTGLRAFEILQAQITDIDQSWLGIRGKGEQFRDVWLSEDAYAALVRWEAVRAPIADGCDNLVIELKGGAKPISYESLRWWMQHLREASGVKHFTAHTLRHTRAQYLMDTTKDIELVANQLGHQSILSTQTYLRRTREQIAQKLRA